MTEEKTIIYRDESGAEVNIKDFERVMAENHLQMRMEYDHRPDSRVQVEAIRRNFVGLGHLPPVLLELYKTDEHGAAMGDPIVEWVTNYPFLICRNLMKGIVDNEWTPELRKYATVVNPHPQR